ncbi:MAG: ABC transporter substrate-binding protein [Candidatus Handelsmanbacteria bacterium]|nr:ABC transporter substrate-binding protein [Candidatus Handelsmanbacteria bacterium]
MKTLTLMLSLLALAGCGEKPAPPSGVRLALNWFPEAEHGGFYAALVHGYFQQEGAQVEILAGGPDAPVIQRVATGAVEFGVCNADDVLNARAQQAPVVALLAPYQTNPRCIMVHASSGITAIDQLQNLTIGLSQRPAFSHYLRKKFPLTGVQIVPYPGNVAQFLLDPRFAQQAYVFSEPFVARKQGADPRVLLVADIGFNPYASVLIATEETISRRPELVKAVVRASLAGWEHYLRQPEPTNQQLHQLNPEMDLDILAYGVEQSRPLVQLAGQPLGNMSLERWQTLLQQMAEAELIEPGKVKPEEAFTTRFLQ